MTKTPLWSVESERALLSACILRPEVVDVVRAVVTPDSFAIDSNKHVFAAIISLADAGSTIDMEQVYQELRRVGRDAQIGGSPYLVQLVQATPAIANPESHARIVRNYERQRDALLASRQFAVEAASPAEDLEALIGSYAAKLADLAADQRGSELRSMADVMPLVRDKILEAKEAGTDVTGVPSGFTSLDKLTTGSHEGDLSIVAGRPGMGKTSFVLCQALNEAVAGYAAPIFSLEMPAIQLGMRFVSIDARVDLTRIRSGTVRPSDWGKVMDSVQRLSRLPIFIDDSNSLNPHHIQSRIRKLQRDVERGRHQQVKHKRFAPVNIDYIQLMTSPEKRQNREEEVGKISNGLKTLAKELGVHVRAVSQLNRQTEQRGKNHRPGLGDLRNSGALEQDADNIIFIYRDEYYFKEDSVAKGVAEVIIAKQRNGPTETVRVRFTGAYTRFDNLESSDKFNDFDDDLEYGGL